MSTTIKEGMRQKSMSQGARPVNGRKHVVTSRQSQMSAEGQRGRVMGTMRKVIKGPLN